MKTASRLLTFEEFEAKLQTNEGTYIWECKSLGKGPARFWWTSDDLYNVSPFPIVDHLTMSMDPGFNAFPRWCFDHYTNLSDGKAFLVSMPHKYNLKEKLRNVRGVDIVFGSRIGLVKMGYDLPHFQLPASLCRSSRLLVSS